jgi:hypothetical protein
MTKLYLEKLKKALKKIVLNFSKSWELAPLLL